MFQSLRPRWFLCVTIGCALSAGCGDIANVGPSGPGGTCNSDEQQYYDLTLEFLEMCNMLEGAENIASCENFITAAETAYNAVTLGPGDPKTFEALVDASITGLQEAIDTETCF